MAKPFQGAHIDHFQLIETMLDHKQTRMCSNLQSAHCGLLIIIYLYTISKYSSLSWFKPVPSEVQIIRNFRWSLNASWTDWLDWINLRLQGIPGTSHDTSSPALLVWGTCLKSHSITSWQHLVANQKWKPKIHSESIWAASLSGHFSAAEAINNCVQGPVKKLDSLHCDFQLFFFQLGNKKERLQGQPWGIGSYQNLKHDFSLSKSS